MPIRLIIDARDLLRMKRVFKKMETKAQNALSRAVTRASAKPFLPEMISRVTVRQGAYSPKHSLHFRAGGTRTPGDLKNSLGIKNKSYKKGRISFSAVGPRTRQAGRRTGKASPWHWMEFGTRDRVQSKTGRKTGRVPKSTFAFIRGTYRAKWREAARVGIRAGKELLMKEWRKSFAGTRS